MRISCFMKEIIPPKSNTTPLGIIPKIYPVAYFLKINTLFGLSPFEDKKAQRYLKRLLFVVVNGRPKFYYITFRLFVKKKSPKNLRK